MHIKHTSRLAALAAVVFFHAAVAQEFLLTDEVFAWNGVSHGREGGLIREIKGQPDNWLEPVNYAKGKVHLYLEILEKPSDIPAFCQTCFYQNGFKTEGCTTGIAFSKPGVYTAVGNVPVAFKNKPPFDHTKRIGTVSTHLREKDHTGDLLRNDIPHHPKNSKRDDLLDHVPIKARFIAVVVARGATFSGWDNYVKQKTGRQERRSPRL